MWINRTFRLIVIAVLALAGRPATAAPATAPAGPAEMFVYIGTYTGPKSKGVYLLKMTPPTGELRLAGVAAELVNPSFLAVHPSQHFLYAAGEISDYNGTHEGVISALKIDRLTGQLTLLNQKPSGGGGPCYVSLDATGKTAFAANYNSGSVESLPVGDDGQLGDPASVMQHAGQGADKRRQLGPHAHCIDRSPDNRFALACDLGVDKIFVYSLDAAAHKLSKNEIPFGATDGGTGPRHLAFHPNGKFVYVIGELANSVTVFSWDAAAGTLKEIQSTPTLPPQFKGNNSTAEIAVHPSGKFLYGSNRGQDSIAIWKIDEGTGKVAWVGYEPTQGKTPRSFGIDPSGAFMLVANMESDSVVLFRIDPQTGKLKATGARVDVPAPVCVKFVPSLGMGPNGGIPMTW